MSDTNERSGASGGSVADGNDLIARLSYLSDDVGRWGGKTIGEAIDEITRLREAIRRLADQDATLSVCDGNVTVTMDAALTDAEREAVDLAIDLLNGVEDVSAGASSRADAAAATLRGLLERLGGRE